MPPAYQTGPENPARRQFFVDASRAAAVPALAATVGLTSIVSAAELLTEKKESQYKGLALGKQVEYNNIIDVSIFGGKTISGTELKISDLEGKLEMVYTLARDNLGRKEVTVYNKSDGTKESYWTESTVFCYVDENGQEFKTRQGRDATSFMSQTALTRKKMYDDFMADHQRFIDEVTKLKNTPKVPSK